MNETNEYKRKLEFLDKEQNKVVAELELEQKGKGLVFSMSGDYKNSGGQCFDSVKPSNKYQKQLLNFWKKHHLNDMHAGTKTQEEALKKLKDFESYEQSTEYLKQIGLYEVTLRNGNTYKYGHGWLYRELPKDVKTHLKGICDNIERIEEENLNEPLDDDEKAEIDEKLENDRIKALKECLDLEDRQLLDVEESSYNETEFSVEGVDYMVVDDDEAEERCRDYLDKDLWIDCVKADRTTDSFKEWQDEAIQMDGYGHILNSWDGNSEETKINDVYYYVMRC